MPWQQWREACSGDDVIAIRAVRKIAFLCKILRRIRRGPLALHCNRIYRQSTTVINCGVCIVEALRQFFFTPARDAEARRVT
jgi:hypothetical protein